MKKSIFTVAAALLLASTAAFAGASVIYTTTNKTETKGYAGLNWTLGGSTTPAVVLGVTRAKVNSNGKMSGTRLAFHLNLSGGIAPGMLKLSYLNGENTLQAEVGAGYNFIKSAPLLTVGLDAPYVAIGIDRYSISEYDAFVTLLTQGKFGKPDGEPTCPTGWAYDPFTNSCSIL